MRKVRQKVRATVLLSEHGHIYKEYLELCYTQKYYYLLSLKTNKKGEEKPIIHVI